jgi:hypothetical protein
VGVGELTGEFVGAILTIASVNVDVISVGAVVIVGLIVVAGALTSIIDAGPLAKGAGGNDGVNPFST